MLIHTLLQALRNLAQYPALIAVVLALYQLISQWIKELRYKHGLAQEDLAGLLDVDVTTVQRWESGKHKPNARHLYRMQLLEARLNDIMRAERLYGFSSTSRAKYTVMEELLRYGANLDDLLKKTIR